MVSLPWTRELIIERPIIEIGLEVGASSSCQGNVVLGEESMCFGR